jgi:hypothetical protein
VTKRLDKKTKAPKYNLLKSHFAEEVVIRPFNLTGYLEVDTNYPCERKTIAIVFLMFDARV